MLSLIMFDYNGTLVNDLSIHAAGYLALARKYNPACTARVIRQMANRPTMDKIRAIARSDDPALLQRILEEKQQLYDEAVRGKDIIFPDAKATIRTLAKRFSLALFTHTTRAQLDMVLPPSLQKQFARILTYEDVRRPKPHPESLQLIMGSLRIPASRAAYVGDSPADIQTAVNAKVLPLGVSTGMHSSGELERAGAKHVFRTLTELTAFLLQHDARNPGP